MWKKTFCFNFAAKSIHTQLSFLTLLIAVVLSAAQPVQATTWLPPETRVCQGETYTQITATGQQRQRVGIKPEYCRCTLGFNPKRHQVCAGTQFVAYCANSQWSHYNQIDFGTSQGWVWNPARSTRYVDETFTQTSNCGKTRTVTGTKPLPDGDGDGVPDKHDSCSGTAPNSSVNAQGCSQIQLDADLDGVLNGSDICPGTAANTSVNAQGCSQIQIDADLDGVLNSVDACPATPSGHSVDSQGCAPIQLDSDNDGVNDAVDQCPNTDASTIDANGCSPSQLDTDNDGVSDAFDQCPATVAGTPVDNLGCELPADDLDGDGISNDQDPYPLQSAVQCPVPSA